MPTVDISELCMIESELKKSPRTAQFMPAIFAEKSLPRIPETDGSTDGSGCSDTTRLHGGWIFWSNL